MTLSPAARGQVNNIEQTTSTWRWAQVVLVGILAAVPLILCLNMRRMAYDDAYITYRYAQNILTGRGFVYNPGERVLGTTTPLYTLFLAGLGLLYPNLPTLSRLLGAVAWSGTVVLSYLLGRRMGTWLTGLAAAGLLALSPLMLTSVGMETPLYVLLFSAAIYCYQSRRFEGASILLALLLLTRGDGILLAAVLGLHYLWRERHVPWRPVILYLFITAPWFLYSTLTFGSPLPNSLAAKMGQATKSGLSDLRERPGSFAFGFVSIGRSLLADSPFYALALPPLLLSLWPRQKYDSRRLVLWGWMLLYILGYVALGVMSFTWYYVPLTLPLALLVGLGLADFCQWLERQLSRTKPLWQTLISLSLLGLVLAALTVGHFTSLSHELFAEIPRPETYRQVGEWLREHTPPDASVATIEIGIIGYYAEREIVDTMGLVTPDVAAHLQSWLQSLQYAISRFRPDYAVTLLQTAWEGMLASNWFAHQYEPCQQINDVTIYCRRDDAPAYTIFREASLQMDEHIQLTTVELERPKVRPGEMLNVVLHWQTDVPLDKSYTVSLALVDEVTNQAWAKTSGYPMHGGAPTTLWQAGEDIADEHHLAVPADTPFGRYQLWIDIDTEAGNMTPVTAIKVMPSEPMTCPAQAQPLQATFGDAVSLVGFGLEGHPRPGETLSLDLCWQAIASPSADYTVFVHLLNAEGHLVTQTDGQPLGGRYPLSIWEPGELVADRYLIQLPSDMLPGSHRLQVGFYDWMTGVRLPAFSSQGVRQRDDSLPLTVIEVTSQE